MIDIGFVQVEIVFESHSSMKKFIDTLDLLHCVKEYNTFESRDGAQKAEVQVNASHAELFLALVANTDGVECCYH